MIRSRLGRLVKQRQMAEGASMSQCLTRMVCQLLFIGRQENSSAHHPQQEDLRHLAVRREKSQERLAVGDDLKMLPIDIVMELFYPSDEGQGLLVNLNVVPFGRLESPKNSRQWVPSGYLSQRSNSLLVK